MLYVYRYDSTPMHSYIQYGYLVSVRLVLQLAPPHHMVGSQAHPALTPLAWLLCVVVQHHPLPCSGGPVDGPTHQPVPPLHDRLPIHILPKVHPQVLLALRH